MRARHPRLGGLMLALRDTPGAPQHERVWAQGAVGEERVQKTLDERCPDIPVLHDRRMPRSRANVDHIAIAPSGVWVIDTKRYVNKKVAVNKPLFAASSLSVGGRNQTKLLDGLTRQVEAVEQALASLPLDVPVRGCLCFVDAEWGILASPQKLDGFFIAWPRALAKWLNDDGPMTDEAVVVVTERLAQCFPVA